MATGKKGSSAPAGEQKQKKPAYEVHIDKTFDDPGKSLRAVASMTIGDFAVHGIKLFQNDNGTFVSMPAIPYKDANGETKYNDIFHPITAEARGELGKAIVAAYNQELATEQTTKQTEAPAQTMQQM